jgi:hypothetical protein
VIRRRSVPKKAILSDVDDVVQVRQAWAEFVEFCKRLGYRPNEIFGIVGEWLSELVETKD